MQATDSQPEHAQFMSDNYTSFCAAELNHAVSHTVIHTVSQAHASVVMGCGSMKSAWVSQTSRVHTYNWHEFNKLQQADLEIFSGATDNCTANHNKNKDEQTKVRDKH